MPRKRTLCRCGKLMEARAFVCRACYLSSARQTRQPVETRTQAEAEAARELWDYWPIWEHYRGRAASCS